MPTVTFQLVVPDQLEKLFEAVRRYYAEDGLAFNPGPVYQGLIQLLLNPALGRAFFLLDERGRRAGYIVFTFGFDHEAGGPLATITDLFVEPACRRQGYARATLQFVAETCRSFGVRGLELQAERRNAKAVSLYQSFGFKAHDRVPMFLPLG